MTRIEKLVYRLRGIKIPEEKVDTTKEDMVKKVNDILLEPESIDTMIPACKNCEHCRIYDQTLDQFRGKAPEYNRPIGVRIESNDFINGVSSSKIKRNSNKCWRERDDEAWHVKDEFFCGKEAIFFKEKKII